MPSLASTIALVAALGSAVLPGLAFAQDVSPALAQRLRDAVAQAEPFAGTPTAAVAPQVYTASQLDTLVGPVALYPDALLAQVLVASTYPDQVSSAADLISRAPGMSDSALSDAVASGNYDQSVLVLLSGFPSVVTRMANDMDWTRNLGAAVASDNAGVMSAIQTMRSEAMDRGNLTTNKAQVVVRNPSGISIRPANPEVVYVPHYDPAVVYETRDAVYAGPQPIATNGFNPIVAGALGFGAGLLVANLWDNDHHSNNNGSSWPGYWRREDVFDWTGGRFYPRPGPHPAPWAPPPPPVGPGGRPLAPPPPPPHAEPGGAPPPPAHAGGQGPGGAGAPPPPPPGDHRPRPSEPSNARSPAPEHRPRGDSLLGYPTPDPRNARPEAQGRATDAQRRPEARDDTHRAEPGYCRHHPNEPACRE